MIRSPVREALRIVNIGRFLFCLLEILRFRKLAFPVIQSRSGSLDLKSKMVSADVA